ETNQSFTATENGNYAVEITENGCTDTSSCHLINSVSIKEELSNNIAIYPNPTTGIFIIEGGNDKYIEIINEVGQTVFIKQYIGNNNQNIVNVSNLPSGIYFVKILSNEKIIIKKLIINNSN
ncbi:MAG: T9SS type A sorting domain-containing protein, partial [Bacteroidales bacterium]|nr:T9SS type A sorting domain-containing protein [Bacteroidales bacterium]